MANTMKGDAEATLCKVAANHPELAELVEQIRNHIAGKLFHELTEDLLVLLEKPVIVCDTKVQIFETVVHPIKDSINLFKFVQLLSYCSENLDPKVALEHLCKYDAFLEKDIEANLMHEIAKAHHMIKDKQLKECDTLLCKVKERVEETMNLDIPVHSAYYRASAELHKVTKNFSQCYKDWIMYLAYTSINEIPEANRAAIAVDITVCAIIADDNCGFGELIRQPIIEYYLKNGSHQWLYDMLIIFNEGQLHMFKEALDRYKGQIVHTDLAGREAQLKNKLTLIALLNLAFSRPNKQRTLNFQDIADHCDIHISEVEPFVLRALALKMIRGYIDEVKQVVHINWIQPRILDMGKLQNVTERMEEWIESTNKLVVTLEELTGQAVASL